MAVTVAQLGSRVLQRLGVLVVAVADRPAVSATRTVAQMAGDALRAVGANPAQTLGGEAGTNTVSDLATQALRHLGILDGNEAPTSQEQTQAEFVVKNVHAHATGLGIANWAENAVPFFASEPYVLMASALLAPEFGRPQDLAVHQAGLDALRAAVLSGSRGLATAQQKVTEAHARLAALGVVTAAADATPVAMAGPIVAMAAAMLAPIYGREADPAALAEAEKQATRTFWAGAGGQARAEQAVRAVHLELAGQGRASWLTSDIPRYAEEPYVWMAASDLAPALGLPPRFDERQEALRTLQRATMVPSARGPVPSEYF
jgi:hypothetical protein